jgi:hypothetical protein
MAPVRVLANARAQCMQQRWIEALLYLLLVGVFAWMWLSHLF